MCLVVIKYKILDLFNIALFKNSTSQYLTGKIMSATKLIIHESDYKVNTISEKNAALLIKLYCLST